ncbi:accessory factor associated with RNA polymerase II [Tilletia horrida]|nr:accessory factor associated with RNA polymerase II [Tilletia horrida]
MDALDALRAAVAAAPADDPLALIEYRAEGDSTTDNLVLAETIVCLLPAAPAPAAFPKLQPTRMLKSAKGNADGTTTPAANPDAFLPLEALVFAIQTRAENLGAYVRQATGRGIARLAPMERGPVLEYLLGKTHSWDGVVALSAADAAGSQAQAAAAAAGAGASAQPGAGPPARSTTPPLEPPAALKARFAASHAAATAANRSASSAARPTAVKRAYVPSRADADFVKRLRTTAERSFLSRADALHGTAPWLKRADFASFRTQIQPVLIVARKGIAALAAGGGRGAPAAPLTLIPQSAPAPSSGAGSSSATTTASGLRVQRKQRAQDPILLLSNSPTALINMFNVKKLLEEGIFVSPDRARQEAGGMAEAVVQISHVPALVADALNPGGGPGAAGAGGAAGGGGAGAGAGPGAGGGAVRKMRFLVVDNADALQRLGGNSARGKDGSAGVAAAGAEAGEDVWNRVVAVFTTGQMWQFKSYKFKEPRELFKHSMGVHVRYSNETLPPVIRDWNITQLQIEPSKRHTDKQLVGHFWRTLEAWIMRRKPFLMPIQPA